MPIVDPRFFPYYPGRKVYRSLSRERIEKELKGENYQKARGSGLAVLSALPRAVKLDGDLKQKLLDRVNDQKVREFLDLAEFVVVQGQMKVFEGEFGNITVGHSPVVALTDKDGNPYCTLPISPKEFYSLLGIRPKEEKIEVPKEVLEEFKERLKSGLEKALQRRQGLFGKDETTKRIEKALAILKKDGDLEKALVEGLTYRPHQAKEGIRLGYLLKKGESALLGWEMRGGKTLTSVLASFLSGRKTTFVFKTANIPDVLGQFRERAPFIENSLAVLTVSGLKIEGYKTYDAMGKVFPNFQAFVAREEKKYASPEYDLPEYLKRKRIKFPSELNPFLERLKKLGYDEELTKRALLWLYDQTSDLNEIDRIVKKVKPVSVYPGDSQFLIVPASRLLNFAVSHSTKGPFWQAVPSNTGVLVVDEADQFVGKDSSSLAGISELASRSEARLFMTGTFTAGEPETAVALSSVLAGKDFEFVKESIEDAKKELGVFTISGTARGKALAFALRLYKTSKEFNPDQFTEEEKLFWQEVEEAFTFSYEETESPDKVVESVLKLLEEGYTIEDISKSFGIPIKRETGTFNPIAFAHSVAPVYLSLKTREQLSNVEEKLIVDVENAKLVEERRGDVALREDFAPDSYQLRLAVDTAYDRYREHSEVLKEILPKFLGALKKLEKQDEAFRRSTSTASDGARTQFLRWIFKGEKPTREEIIPTLKKYYKVLEKELPSMPYEKLTFKRDGWPVKVRLTYSPFFGETASVVDSFANKGLYERIVEGAKSGESLFLTGSLIAPNAFYLIDAMVNAKDGMEFVWRKTGTKYDLLVSRVAEKLGKKLIIAENTAFFGEILENLRKDGKTVIGASTDTAIARGVNLSFMDAMVVTLPSKNLSTAVQLYSRLFSVERHEAEVFLFGTYFKTYKDKLYPSKGHYSAKKTYEGVKFAKAVMEGKLPIEEEQKRIEYTNYSLVNEVDEIIDELGLF